MTSAPEHDSPWEARWASGDVPWDAGAPEPGLLAWLMHQGSRAPTGRVLVPGCGAGYSAAALASPERRVTGLDLAPSSAARFAEVAAKSGVQRFVEHKVGDFFTASLGAPFDLVYDYTFLCALPLALRAAWAARMAELVRPSGTLLCMVFPIVTPAPDYQGPPWPVQVDEVKALLAPHFDVVSETPSERTHPGREGKECLLEMQRRP
jgi:SAM-dependent methyltransferase